MERLFRSYPTGDASYRSQQFIPNAAAAAAAAAAYVTGPWNDGLQYGYPSPSTHIPPPPHHPPPPQPPAFENGWSGLGTAAAAAAVIHNHQSVQQHQQPTAFRHGESPNMSAYQ